MNERLEQLRQAVESNEIRYFERMGYHSQIGRATTAHLRSGKKYVKLDVGNSGRYMIDGDKVYGIKAYGVIHRGHYHGTVQEFTERLQGATIPLRY